MQNLSNSPIKEVNIMISLASSFSEKQEVERFFDKIKQKLFVEKRESKRTSIQRINTKGLKIEELLDGYGFFSADKTRLLTLGKIYFALGLKKYPGFENFIKNYLDLLKIAQECIPNLEIGEDRVLEYRNKMFLPFDKVNKCLRILPVINLDPRNFLLHKFTSRYSIPCNSDQLADIFTEYTSTSKGLDVVFNISVQGKSSDTSLNTLKEDFSVLHELAKKLFFDNLTEEYREDLL